MMRKGMAAGWVLLAAALLTTGCGAGAESAPTDPAGTVDPAPAVLPVPQGACGGSAVPEDPAAPAETAPASAPEAPTSNADPCALSTSRTAGPGEGALEYWTPERMESAIAEMPTVDE